MAVTLVEDAWANSFDVALVISNDSDLTEAIRFAVKKGKSVGILNPRRKMPANALLAVTTFRRSLTTSQLAACQLPTPIPGTTITKPSSW